MTYRKPKLFQPTENEKKEALTRLLSQCLPPKTEEMKNPNYQVGDDVIIKITEEIKTSDLEKSGTTTKRVLVTILNVFPGRVRTTRGDFEATAIERVVAKQMELFN